MSNDLVKRLRDLTSLVARTMPPAWREQCELCSGSADRIEELEAKLAKVTAAYRLEAMKRDDYSHDAFDKHLAELTGDKDE